MRHGPQQSLFTNHGRRQNIRTWATCTMMAGLALVLILTLVGCSQSQPPEPSTQAVELPPPAEVSTPAAAPASPAPETVPTSPEEQGGPTQDGRPLAARVNDQPLFLDIYEKQVAQTEQALVEQGLLLDGEEGQAQLAQIRQNVLNGLIEQALIEQAAAGMGISVSDEELETTVQASIQLGQGQESFDLWLAENSMTMEEFRETQRSQLLASKMIENVIASVPTTAEQVHARHIRISDLAKAESLLAELNSGANFAALAQRDSEDMGTAVNGGDLGWFPQDAPLMPAHVVEAAFALQAGEISGAIESELGYHIIKVEAREANRPLTPEMLLYVQQRAFEKWLAGQWAGSTIETYIGS